jgi:pimeloyl-ACP methyl ester carboxylesterase
LNGQDRRSAESAAANQGRAAAGLGSGRLGLAALAVLNGIVGDQLAGAAEALAIPLRLRQHGRTLEIARAALAEAIPGATGKLVVLVHGLCCSDRRWRRQGHDHGAALGRDLGYTPLYLHYNSGLHISANGRAFAALLERLVAEWPVEVEEIALIGHSMGGLVARSACFYGKSARHAWVGKLRHMVFLGTPHHGVPLERAANRVFVPLGKYIVTTPLAQFARWRSAGITDLRHGCLVDEDWHGKDRFAHADDRRRTVPLPRGVKCYAIAGTTGARPGDLRDRLLGDGLVPLDSALGRHQDARRTLGFASERTWIAAGVHHFDLLSRIDVYERIRDWLAGERRRGAWRAEEAIPQV